MPGVEAEMKLVQDLGGDFVSFQYEIAKNYYNTAGAYREDADYAKRSPRGSHRRRRSAPRRSGD
jgi:hypothetical protein